MPNDLKAPWHYAPAKDQMGGIVFYNVFDANGRHLATVSHEEDAQKISATADMAEALKNFVYEASLPRSRMDEGNVEVAKLALAKAGVEL